MIKKLLILTSTILIFVLFGRIIISNQNNSEGNRVVFWTLQMSDFSDYIDGVIKEFELQNPNTKIYWIDVPFSEGEKRTLASVLSNNPPDLINSNPDFTALLAQKNALYEINPKDTAQFLPEIINALKYDDKIYSIPWYATSAVTIYNKKLINNSGVNIPKTYYELSEIAPVIKLKTNSYVWLPNISENDTMLKILNKYGINSAETINSEKSADVFNLFKNLYKKNLIPKESITQTHREALEKYMSESIVIFQAGANFLNMIKENAPSTYANTDVTTQLTGDLGQFDFSIINFVIPKKAKNKQMALKFALF